MQEKITRAKLNSMAKKYEIDYSGKKMDQLCKELVKKGEKLSCVSPRVVLSGDINALDNGTIKSNESKSDETISKKSKSIKKSPKIQSDRQPAKPKGEKINRKELIDIAKEYKISYTGKRMNIICKELVQKGAPLKCKSPKIILSLREFSPKKARQTSPKKVTQSSPKTKTQVSPKKATQASPKTKTQVSPKKTTQASPKTKTQASPKKTSQASPKKTSQASPKKTSQASPKKILPKKSEKKVAKKSIKQKMSETEMKSIKLKNNETLENIECVAIDQKISGDEEISRVENKKNTKSYNMAKNWLDFFQNYSYIDITAHIRVVEENEYSKLTTYRHKTLYSKGSIIDFEDFGDL